LPTTKFTFQGSHSFPDKKSRTSPGFSRTILRNFAGPYRSPQMLKYKEKRSPRPEGLRTVCGVVVLGDGAA